MNKSGLLIYKVVTRKEKVVTSEIDFIYYVSAINICFIAGSIESNYSRDFYIPNDYTRKSLWSIVL